MRLVFSLLCLICGLCWSAANAEMYRWVDEKGKVHYTDTPPPANIKNRRTLKPAARAPAPPPAAPADSAAAAGLDAKGKPADSGTAPPPLDKEQSFRKRRQEKEEAQKKAEQEQQEKKDKAAACERAKGALRSLEDGGRVVKYDAAGERSFLGDDERRREIAAARRDADTWCK